MLPAEPVKVDSQVFEVVDSIRAPVSSLIQTCLSVNIMYLTPKRRDSKLCMSFGG